MNKAIFLDRDGVINEIVFHEDVEVLDSPFNIEQVEILNGVPEAISTFNRLGFKVLVVTNQPSAAKGKIDLARIEEINQHITKSLFTSGAQIDRVYCCPHHPVGTPKGDPDLITKCACRKPSPGMLRSGIEDFQVDVNGSYMVGDSISDIQAGQAIGLTSVLVGGLKCDARRLFEEKGCIPDLIYQSLWDFAESLT
jgi:D-glycero-D-manno-heptose 1,7-bisphosphate phosphatase